MFRNDSERNRSNRLISYMATPFFSVIIPTYNRNHLISETLESVLAQTFKDFELIIVDDGSTDNTQEVISKYLSDPRVKYVYQENKERGAARNRGAKDAKGLYLNFFDSDDIMLPENLAKAYELIMQYGIDKVLWLHGGFSLLIDGVITNINKSILNGYVFKKIIKSMDICIITVFIRNDFFNQLLFDEDRELSGAEDGELITRAAFKAPVFYQPINTILIRQHANRSMASPQVIERASSRAIEKIYSNKELMPFIRRYKRISYAYKHILVAIAWFSVSDIKKSRHYLKMSFKEMPLIIFSPRFQKWIIRMYLIPLMNYSTRYNKVLYLTYNGLCQPLGQSQVIPYLIGLSKQGYKFTIISFEHYYEKDFEREYKKIKTQLDEAGIEWIALKYHKHPRFFSTIYDIMHGIIKAIHYYTQKPYYIVHARSYVPAMIGLILKKLFRIKLIFDMRGMMADEKIDAKEWRRTSLPYKLTKSSEIILLKNSDAIIVLTEKIKTYLQGFTYIKAPLSVTTTCVDINRFPPMNMLNRNKMRDLLDIANKVVIVYSGSIGTWYLFNEMAAFFKAIKFYEKKAFFLILNRNEHDVAKNILDKHSINKSDYLIKGVSPDEVHEYLWASDIGMYFIKPAFSKQASIPTKLNEYLACGLPVIGNVGVGDTEDIILKENLGAIVYKFDDEEYKKAFKNADQLIHDPDFQKRAYHMVKDSMSVEIGVGRYKKIYEYLK